MWDFFETVRHRHSVRKYRSDMAVEQEKLHAVLEMACAAPSAGDLQSYHIAVVTTPALREALAAATDNPSFLAAAPLAATGVLRAAWLLLVFPAIGAAVLLLGGLPLALVGGMGSELRRPLGISIVGGLIVSQLLTLFTTPVIYLYMDRLRLWRERRQDRPAEGAPELRPTSLPDSSVG